MIELITIATQPYLYNRRYTYDTSIVIYDTEKTLRTITQATIRKTKTLPCFIEKRILDLESGKYILSEKNDLPRRQANKLLKDITEKCKNASETVKTTNFSHYYFRKD